jgi:hypothetical protein
LQQRFRRLGRQVRGHVEERVLGHGAHVAEPVGRHSHREERRNQSQANDTGARLPQNFERDVASQRKPDQRKAGRGASL